MQFYSILSVLTFELNFEYKVYWFAERECNKDEINNTAIFIEYRRCNFRRRKYFIKIIFGSATSEVVESL